MSPKLKREIQSNDLAVRCCKVGLANLLRTEAARYQALRAQIIVKTFPHPGTAENLRLIRDHEVRAETFKTAATLIAS
jgi:hypothetical protein